MHEWIALFILLWLFPIVILNILVQLAIKFWRRLGLKSYYILVPLLSSLISLFFNFRNSIFSISFTLPWLLQFVGVVMLIFGLTFFWWALRAIGIKNALWYSEIKNEKKGFVKHGPYTFCRHPMYFSSTIVASSAFLMSGAIVFLLIIPLLFILAVIEEKECECRFGTKYAKYSKKVPMIFPIKLKTQ